MSRLTRFQRKPKELEFTLEDESGKEIIEKIKVIPLKVRNMDMMLDMGKEGKASEAIHRIIKKVLDDNGIKDYTEEEYQNMDYEFIDQILDAAMGQSVANMSDTKQKFLENIKAKQEASKK